MTELTKIESDHNLPEMETIDGRPMVSSLEIAKRFEKRHDNVLQAIENLECSKRFRLLNFQESNYKNKQGKTMPSSLVTRDGFAFLVMGFTGKKAAAWKERFLEAFNAMEEQLKKNYQAFDGMQVAIQGIKNCLVRLTEMTGENKAGIVTVSGKVDKLGHKVGRIEKRMDVLEIARRRKISEKTKALHRKVVAKYFNGLCPVCNERPIQEYDHFKSASWNTPRDTWPLCSHCHGQLTYGDLSRAGDVDLIFKFYQQRLEQYENPQTQLGFFDHDGTNPE